MSAADFDADTRGYEEEVRGYEGERDRNSRSPRGADSRARSASPNGRERSDARGPSKQQQQDDEESQNPGTNLFVTGIHPRLSEADVKELFEKYGEVKKANIMRDPHSGESRGFGFVDMETGQAADAARDALQGMVHEGRTLSIEKARRARPRTPTPGKYYGPPKREFGGRAPRGGGRYEDRRGGGGGGGRRDDYYGGGGYRGGSRGGYDRYDDRGGNGGGDYDRRYRERGEYGRSDRYGGAPRDGPPRDGPREDRYGGGGSAPREDRYGGGREERRGGGGGGGYYGGGGREDRGYDGAAPPPRENRDPYAGGRSYDDRGDDRYSR